MIMQLLIAFFRLALAFFAFRGTLTAWTFADPHSFVFFTTQTNLLLGLCFTWSGFATLFPYRQPPVWLKGALLLYILITGLVAFFILDPPDPNLPKVFLGLTIMDMVHIVTPSMATIECLLFERHRQLRIKNAALWLLYPVIYFICILIIVGICPSIGYPYPFIDLNVLDTIDVVGNVVTYAIGFFILGLVIVGVDSI
jgi:hypothetical protein